MHSFLRWVALVLLVWSVVAAWRGAGSGKSFTDGDKKRGMFTMIVLHVQLVLGFALWFLGGRGMKAFADPEVMTNSVLRFFAVEHMVGMILGIVLGTLGHSLSKRASGDHAKFRKQAIFFTLALVVILAMIPWPFREGFEWVGWH